MRWDPCYTSIFFFFYVYERDDGCSYGCKKPYILKGRNKGRSENIDLKIQIRRLCDYRLNQG